MNKIINKFLLAGDTFMPEIHLRLMVLVDYLINILQGLKNSNKQAI